MKRPVVNAFKFLMVFFLVLSGTKNGQSQAQEPTLKGEDIWERTISYHDPHGNWISFKGKMQLVTVFPNNYVVKETIEINKPDDYYLSTAFQEFGTVKRGMNKGKHFSSLDDNPTVSEEIRNNWGLSEEGISGYKSWHTGLIGLPMHLKSTGMKVQEKVNTVDFNGRKCYELIFVGTSDLVFDKNYAGKLILYVDTRTFSMGGTRWELSGQPAIYIVYSKEIEINGIRIPHVMSCYNVENDTPSFSSINNPFNK